MTLMVFSTKHLSWYSQTCVAMTRVLDSLILNEEKASG